MSALIPHRTLTRCWTRGSPTQPRPVTGAPNLFAMNIDPEKAADDYRGRVLDQMNEKSSDMERATVREQLSGACTTEIAAFDEFVGLLTTTDNGYDHVIFDTAPTGHTLRLLSLPKAWTGFLKDNDRGASCLGPHSGLKMQEARFQAAVAALGNPQLTTIILVARPDKITIREAARTSAELRALGLDNQRLAINGVFTASDKSDEVARSIETLGQTRAGGVAGGPKFSAAGPHSPENLRYGGPWSLAPGAECCAHRVKG